MGVPVLKSQFPSFAAATTAVAPASLFTGTRWTPTLSSGVDYVLDLLTNNPNRVPATGGINIQHGRHVLIPPSHLSQSADGGPNLYLSGGDQDRDICGEGVLIDVSAGGESDGIRSHMVGALDPANTTLKLLNCRQENLRGQSNPQGGGSTTLSAALTSGAVSLTVASSSAAPSTPFGVLIDTEFIIVGAVAGTTWSSLERGAYGPNAPTIAASHLSGATVTYADNLGRVTAGTHADCFQFPGGLGKLMVESCSFGSAYSIFQNQHEHTQNNEAYKTIDLATDVGPSGGRKIVRFRTTTAHGYSVGDWAQVGKGLAMTNNGNSTGTSLAPSGWNGTYHIVNIPDTTHFDVDFGPNSALGCTIPGSFTGSGTVCRSQFTNMVGDQWFNRVDVFAQPNLQQYRSLDPGSTLNGLRFGGRPDYKGYGDVTPLTVEGVGDSITPSGLRVVTFSEFYLQPYTGSEDPAPQAFGSLVHPSAGDYGEGAAVVSGTAPNRTLAWPNWPLGGVVGQINEGTPPGGSFCPRVRVGYGYPKVLAA